MQTRSTEHFTECTKGACGPGSVPADGRGTPFAEKTQLVPQPHTLGLSGVWVTEGGVVLVVLLFFPAPYPIFIMWNS